MTGRTLEDELHNVFTDEYISGLIKMLYSMAERFFSEYELRNKVFLDENILEYCFIDILVDLARIKPFHEISNLNMAKIISYSASWWIRRKPFQRINGACDDTLYVNELFALFLLLHAMNVQKQQVVYEQIKEHLRQIVYHLKYRNTNPQTLELLIAGYDMGRQRRETTQ